MSNCTCGGEDSMYCVCSVAKLGEEVKLLKTATFDLKRTFVNILHKWHGDLSVENISLIRKRQMMLEIEAVLEELK